MSPEPTLKESGPDGSITLEGVRITYRNLEGRPGRFDPEGGKRDFAIVLTDDMAERLHQSGWNVKSKPPREEGDSSYHTLKIKANYGGRSNPLVVLNTSKNRTALPEDLLSMVDGADIDFCDVTVNPYRYQGGPKTAYLKTMIVVLNEDQLIQKYDHLPWVGANGELNASYDAPVKALESGYQPPEYDYDGEVVSDDEVLEGERLALEKSWKSGEIGQ